MLSPLQNLLQRWREIRLKTKVKRIIVSDSLCVTVSPCDPQCIIVAPREDTSTADFFTPRVMKSPVALPGVYPSSPRNKIVKPEFRRAYHRLPVVTAAV